MRHNWVKAHQSSQGDPANTYIRRKRHEEGAAAKKMAEASDIPQNSQKKEAKKLDKKHERNKFAKRTINYTNFMDVLTITN